MTYFSLGKSYYMNWRELVYVLLTITIIDWFERELFFGLNVSPK